MLYLWIIISRLPCIQKFNEASYAMQIFTRSFCWITVFHHVFPSHVIANVMYLFSDCTMYTYSKVILIVGFDTDQ